MDEYIKEISNNISLNNVNSFLLSNYEMEVLDRYNIDYNLEEISISISDRDYYQNTEK